LAEIFAVYVRKNPEKHFHFDAMQEGHSRLSLKGFLSFIKDMQIPIDHTRLTEIWKKSSSNNQNFTFDDFKRSLDKVAIQSAKYDIEQLKKRVFQLKIVIKSLEA
jgi:hypothetical protein